MRVLLAFIIGCFLCTANAQVPNTFTPGTPAKAAEVNENFEFLNSAIENLEKNQSSLLNQLPFEIVDSSGSTIPTATMAGPLVFDTIIQGEELTLLVEIDDSGVVTPNNRTPTSYFESNDCSGEGFTTSNSENPEPFGSLAGFGILGTTPVSDTEIAYSVGEPVPLQDQNNISSVSDAGRCFETNGFVPGEAGPLFRIKTIQIAEIEQRFPPPYSLVRRSN